MKSLRHEGWLTWIWLVLAVFLTLFTFWGLDKIPFHPDESTQLYTSRDFETLLTNPLAMSWERGMAFDLPTHYRLVDAPLTKYLLGLGRSLAGYSALPVDWNWSNSWAENQSVGALPTEGLLLAGRSILALFLPLDLMLIYLIGKRIQSRATGLIATLLFGLNALVLVHDRRCMAEAVLTFGVLFSLWSFLDGWRHPWLVGLGIAVAFNAKQTGAALLPAGILAVVLPESSFKNKQEIASGNFGHIWRIAQFGLVFLLITWVLNPFLWTHPFQAVEAAWIERQELLQRQVADFERLSPENSLNTPLKRIAALLANLFIVPPAFAETANYLQETKTAEQIYLSVHGHNLLRGFYAGGLYLILTLAGMILAIFDLRRKNHNPRRNLILILTATIIMGVGIYWLVPLPWQRYVLPLVPLACLWTAYALTAPLDRFG